MIIKKLRIKNFRSIADLQIDFADLTVVMGDNDAGKSNVLRAINLFFNNRTDGEKLFNFHQDFNRNAVTPANKAKEILIELTLQAPERYQDTQDIFWRKAWRRDGLAVERELRQLADGSDFSTRSKLNIWLSRIKFKYVPATKGLDYFSELLGDLHDSLSNTVDDQIKTAAKGFTTTINKHTKSIFDELDTRLGIKSSIQLPSDLKVLFANLDFQADKNEISLQQRGDGIKARHIPIILRFLADQDNALRDRGSAKYNHIWGYEEPENNLELSKAFLLAQEFVEYCTDVQVILTTHSPAFYGLYKNGAQIHHVSKPVGALNSVSAAIDLSSAGSMDELMGVMPLVSPYVEEVVAKYQELLDKADALAKISSKKPTVFVEGPSDVAILRRAIQVFSPGLSEQISIKASDSHGGGEGWVTDMLLAWLHNREEIPSAGIFDNDAQGKRGKKKVTDNPKYGSQPAVKAFTFKAPMHLRNVFHKKINLSVSIEEVVGISAWRHAEKEGWLKQRSDLTALNPDLTSNFDVAVSKALEEKAFSDDELLYVRHVIGSDFKESFSRYISRLSDTNARLVLSAFEQLAADIRAHLLTVKKSTEPDQLTKT
jgi:predicted ATP-dependent endonuclease of OLD family